MKRPLYWLCGALNTTIIASTVSVGPSQSVLLFLAGTVLLISLLYHAGFPLLLALLSQVTVIEGLEFETFRIIRWGLVAAFALFTLTRWAIEHRVISRKFTYVEWYFAFYLVWGIFCSLISLHPQEGLKIVLSKTLFYGAFFLTTCTLTSRKDVKVLLSILLLGVLASGIYSFALTVSEGYSRFRGFHDNPNSYGTILFLTLPLLYAAYKLFADLKMRLLFASGIVAGSFSLLLTWSRNSIGALCIGTIVYLLLEKRKKTIAIIAE